MQDAQNKLWVGTSGGLARIDPRTYNINSYVHDPANSKSLSHNDVRAILPDSDGRLWVATKGGGINVLVGDAGAGSPVEFRHIRHEAGNEMSLNDDNVESLFRDRDGHLWAATDDGLSRLVDGVNNDFVRYWHDAADSYSLPDNDIEVIYQDRSGRLWIGTSSGLAKYDRAADRFERIFPEPASQKSLRNFIWSIYEDSRGQLWVGTVGGLARYQNDAFEFYCHNPENQRSISHNVISAHL